MEQLLTYAQESGSEGSGMSTIIWIATAVGLWKMFEKAGEPGWAGIIPFYNQYKLCEKVMGDPWYWVRLFVGVIPLVGWIAYLYFQYQIGKATAKAYGQPESWAWGYTFLSPVFYCITGFGNYDYYGPYGRGDRRTGEARAAKTVDFDVIKNDTVEPAAQPQPEVKVQDVSEVKDVSFETKESDVEFDFNQSDYME